MKLTLRTAVIAAGLAAAAWPSLRAADEASQPPPPPPPPAGTGGEKGPEAGPPKRWQRDPMEQLERLKQALNLTPEQSDQIAAVIKGNAPQRQAIMSDDSLSRDDKRAKMRELMNGTQAKIRALLTPEQQTKFDAMPRPGRGDRNGGPGHGPPPPPSGDTPPPANPPAPAGGGTT